MTPQQSTLRHPPSRSVLSDLLQRHLSDPSVRAWLLDSQPLVKVSRDALTSALGYMCRWPTGVAGAFEAAREDPGDLFICERIAGSAALGIIFGPSEELPYAVAANHLEPLNSSLKTRVRRVAIKIWGDFLTCVECNWMSDLSLVIVGKIIRISGISGTASRTCGEIWFYPRGTKGGGDPHGPEGIGLPERVVTYLEAPHFCDMCGGAGCSFCCTTQAPGPKPASSEPAPSESAASEPGPPLQGDPWCDFAQPADTTEPSGLVSWDNMSRRLRCLSFIGEVDVHYFKSPEFFTAARKGLALPPTLPVDSVGGCLHFFGSLPFRLPYQCVTGNASNAEQLRQLYLSTFWSSDVGNRLECRLWNMQTGSNCTSPPSNTLSDPSNMSNAVEVYLATDAADEQSADQTADQTMDHTANQSACNIGEQAAQQTAGQHDEKPGQQALVNQLKPLLEDPPPTKPEVKLEYGIGIVEELHGLIEHEVKNRRIISGSIKDGQRSPSTLELPPALDSSPRLSDTLVSPPLDESQPSRPRVSADMCAIKVSDRDYRCTICNKGFVKKSNAMRHRLTVHDKQRPFKCDMCKAAFGHRTHLTRHQVALHGVGVAKAPRSYTRPSAFSARRGGLGNGAAEANSGVTVDTSTGTERFECSLCRHKFSQRSNLNRHFRSAHEKRRIQCQICQSDFGQMYDLQRHFRRKHPAYNNPQNYCLVIFKGNDQLRQLSTNTTSPTYSSPGSARYQTNMTIGQGRSPQQASLVVRNALGQSALNRNVLSYHPINNSTLPPRSLHTGGNLSHAHSEFSHVAYSSQ